MGVLQSSSIPTLGWDKGATSTLSNRTFWTFGDVLAVPEFTFKTGFADTAAFYATPSDILTVDTGDITNVYGHQFGRPYVDDEPPDPKGKTPSWGIGTSNVVEIEDGLGLAWQWEAWRNTKEAYVQRGGGIMEVTLGETMPIGNRTGPLVSGPDSLQVGMMTIMKADGYVYVYSQGGFSPTGVVVGRVPISSAFSADAYEFQMTNGTWVSGIPLKDDPDYGMTRGGGLIHNDGMGSVMWSNYFKKYMMFVCAFGNDVNFYTSDTPYGPWSEEYNLIHVLGYGIAVHPQWSPGDDGSHQRIYISSGWGNIITMYEVDFAL